MEKKNEGVNRVYVGNLPLSLNGDDLKEIFSPFGNVLDARIEKEDYYKRSRGFGFVSFSSAGEVKKAVEEMNGEEFQGRKLSVRIAEVERKK